MIIYIHGFAGSGEGSKATILKKLLGHHGIIAPSLSYVPSLAIKTLEELIEKFIKTERVYLIGSSLGGFYATYLGHRYILPTILINPDTNPKETLQKAIGDATNFYDNSHFSWSQKHLNMLDQYKVDIEDGYYALYMCLLQKEDELLDYKKVEEKYQYSNLIIEEGGTHSFDGIERYVDEMISFFVKTKKELPKIDYFIERIGILEFLRSTDITDLAKIFKYYDEEFKQNILNNMSQRQRDNFLEEVKCNENLPLDDLSDIYDSIEENIKEKHSHQIEDIIEKLNNDNIKSDYVEDYEYLSQDEIDALLALPGEDEPFYQDGFQDALKYISKVYDKEQLYHTISVIGVLVKVFIENDYKNINDVLKLACLQDILNYTNIQFEDIKKEFEYYTSSTNAVLSFTYNKTLTSKTQQVVDSINRIKKQPKWAWLVKLADTYCKLDNLDKNNDIKLKQNYLKDARTVYIELSAADVLLSRKLLQKIQNSEREILV